VRFVKRDIDNFDRLFDNGRSAAQIWKSSCLKVYKVNGKIGIVVGGS